MRNVVIFSVLFMLLITPVFAQEEERETGWNVSVEAQVSGDVMSFFHASGSIKGSGTDQEWGQNIDGSFNFMGTDSSMTPESQLALTIGNYNKGDNWMYDFYLQFVLYGRNLSNVNNIQGFFSNFEIGDWYLTGSAGKFEGYLGNTGYNGFVPIYDNFTEWSISYYFQGFYVKALEGENIVRYYSNTMNYLGEGDYPSLVFGVNLNDNFRFALGTVIENPDAYYGFTNPYASAAGINMSTKISGRLDIFDFDLFYAVAGQDDNTNQRGGASFKNTIGFHAGLSPSDAFGINVGYTGHFIGHEVSQAGNDTYNTISPLWSAINVHINFVGIDKFDITFNNSINFAGATNKIGTKPSDDVLLPLYNSYIFWNEDGDKQGYFGWDAALAVRYHATENFTIILQLANLLDSLTLTPRTGNEIVTTYNTFFIGLNAEYVIGPVTFGAGLQCGGITVERKIGSDTTTINEMYFGLPLFFKVSF